MLTQTQLESHLWQAAQLLRGSVDSGDFKHYILALLFYKRLCDVWEEGQQAAGVSFEVSPEYRWSALCAAGGNLGSRLNRAFAELEHRNPALRGIFQDLDFGHQARFPDALLRRLLDHFDLHFLGHSMVEQDVLGRAYEYLIARFADDAGKKGGEFYTPKEVATLMVKCLAPTCEMSVYDPSCGTGGLLLQAADHIAQDSGGAARPALFGQEKNLNTWAICKMNMFLHGLENADIRRGDTLLNPQHLMANAPHRLQTFDRVIANPPFSLKSWGEEQWRQGDRFQRDLYGCPPNGTADFAFIQHMLSSLEPEGLMSVVVPCGILFREKREGQIRKKLVEADHIEAIVALPKNLFYGTGIPTCVLFARKQKRPERKHRVLFVDAMNLARSQGKKDVLTVQGLRRVTQLFHDWSLFDPCARVVSREDIEASGYNLTIQRYLHPRPQAKVEPGDCGLESLMQAKWARDQAEAQLFQDLTALGYGSDLDSNRRSNRRSN